MEGKIAWMLTASALVFFMTPGLAFFYGGLVRAKNLVNTIMYCFVSIAVVSIVWVLWGFSIAFDDGGSANDFIGGFSMVGLQNVPFDGSGDWTLLDVTFQMMFAIITPALITGAFVERFKFSTYLIFLVIWSTVVYSPVTHWVWGGGWISQLGDGRGALDFAGGTVIHINAGIAALAAAWLLGKRRNPGLQSNNVPYVVLGAAILWFGWFGFNAGSAGTADNSAVNAFLVTNVAAAAAALTWGLISMIRTGKMGAIGVATGAVAGLVAITPAAGAVGVMGSLAIGFGAGVLCFIAVELIHRTGLDDALDVFAVHGIGGIWGALAAGIFTVSVIAGDDYRGLVEHGDLEQLGIQAVSVLGTLVYSAVATLIILYILDKIPGLGLRVSEAEEDMGLDLASHGEQASVGDGAD
ncbi:MAG: ammonia channel protein [Chloroflexi bacterium]|nr:ammonia channel protein [Chloroflexota bacterium]